MMSGSDMNSWAVMNSTQSPVEYARQLSDIVGCGGGDGDEIIKCLRSRSPPDIVNAAEKVSLVVRVTIYRSHVLLFIDVICYYL